MASSSGRECRTVPYGKPDRLGFQMTGPECPECYALYPKAWPPSNEVGIEPFGFWKCDVCDCIYDRGEREEL